MPAGAAIEAIGHVLDERPSQLLVECGRLGIAESPAHNAQSPANAPAGAARPHLPAVLPAPRVAPAGHDERRNEQHGEREQHPEHRALARPCTRERESPLQAP